MRNTGKVFVNASILYKNQEICNKTNLWKFQFISLFLLRENSILVIILMAGVFVSRDEKSLLDLISLIIRKREHIRESFLPSLSLYHVSYVQICEHFSFSVLPMLSRGFNPFITIGNFSLLRSPYPSYARLESVTLDLSNGVGKPTCCYYWNQT